MFDAMVSTPAEPFGLVFCAKQFAGHCVEGSPRTST